MSACARSVTFQKRLRPISVGELTSVAAFGSVTALFHPVCEFWRFDGGDIGDVRGAVSAVGGVNTVVATAAGMVVIPNGLLIDSIVQAPRAPEQPAS